jgi:hypothetical protein
MVTEHGNTNHGRKILLAHGSYPTAGVLCRAEARSSWLSPSSPGSPHSGDRIGFVFQSFNLVPTIPPNGPWSRGPARDVRHRRDMPGTRSDTSGREKMNGHG